MPNTAEFLTTWERLMCAAIIGGITGTAAEIRAAGKVLDVLEMTADEREMAGVVVNPDGGMAWKSDDGLWNCLMVLDSAGLTLLKRSVITFTGWTARDAKRVDALMAKLDLL